MRRELALRDIFKKSTGIHSNSSHSLFQRKSFSFLSCKALVSENIPFISSWPQCPQMANWLCARRSNSSVVCVFLWAYKCLFKLLSMSNLIFASVLLSQTQQWTLRLTLEFIARSTTNSQLNMQRPSVKKSPCHIQITSCSKIMTLPKGNSCLFHLFSLLKKYWIWNSSSLESL